MKILLINTLYAPMLLGGAERSVTLLAEELVRRGDEVAVITLHPEPGESVATLNGVRVYRLPMDNRYWPFARGAKAGAASRLLWHVGDAWNREAAERVGRILDREKPEVVHTNVIAGFSVAIWQEVKKRKIRLVHTLRDYYLLCSRSALFRRGSTCTRRCMECSAMTANRKSASQMVDAVVSISEYVLRAHEQRGYFAQASSSVIYNIAGANNTGSAAKTNPKNESDDAFVFGYIGKLEPEKGIQIVLEASERLSGSHWRLKIAGAGLEHYVRFLKQKFTDPRIEWLGFANPWEFYSQIDTTIVASIWPEPLGRTVIESFAAGKSAICARSGGIPEIAQLGKVAATYPAKDVASLAAVMDRAMLDADAWRAGGFRDADARKLFTDAFISSAYQEIYRPPAKQSTPLAG